MRRGGPLPRRAALAAGVPLTRKTPMPRRRQAQVAIPRIGTPPRPRRTLAPRHFTEATRKLIYARDERCCVRCGVNIASCPWSGSVQHRCPRGAGGSTVAWLQRPANGLLLCGSGTTGCHGWVESHPADAARYGWVLRHGVITAAQWPVLYAAAGDVRLLDDHGGYRVLMVLDERGYDPLADPRFAVGAYTADPP